MPKCDENIPNCYAKIIKCSHCTQNIIIHTFFSNKEIKLGYNMADVKKNMRKHTIQFHEIKMIYLVILYCFT